MKKILYVAACFCTLCLGTISCDKGISDDVIRKHDSTPEITAAGEYIGKWIRMSSTDTLIGNGSILFEADTAYIVNITFLCDTFSLNKSTLANISYHNDGFTYFNGSTTNGLGCSFSGSINDAKENNITFTITQMINRRVKKFTYQFNGVKKEE